MASRATPRIPPSANSRNGSTARASPRSRCARASRALSSSGCSTGSRARSRLGPTRKTMRRTTRRSACTWASRCSATTGSRCRTKMKRPAAPTPPENGSGASWPMRRSSGGTGSTARSRAAEPRSRGACRLPCPPPTSRRPRPRRTPPRRGRRWQCDRHANSPLLDALAISESEATRRIILDRLRVLGDAIRGPIRARIPGAP